ncbi:NAD(P)H-dependent flavin oxidoreductase [Chenggangzhangella methanolivorans]|uniref:Nitronate monooxygenase family protein n=1 Tax=Chenggangzhangella methanolivorans TaxID=1437009 RepID=A0A9E6R8N8_9HYPH|nr:nitronate monooxygenase family protein [Chenggangzhangella methanolivorans]QZO00104.1 nitronate monooxygenase family protein [Chenggangzhangella methanolivorans]
MPLPKLLEGRLSIPVIGAPMFIVSGPELVVAQCKAGVVGSFPALNARPADQLDVWLGRIEDELTAFADANPGAPVAPYAVNQIVHSSNARLGEDMTVCARRRVPIVITSLRSPNEVVKAAHDWGGVVLHDVISVRHAEKALEAGVDGLILVCAGAGGHAGMLSPFALTQEVRAIFDGPIVLSGAIATEGRCSPRRRRARTSLMSARASSTKEANADPRYKEMLVAGAASDIVYSSLFTGVHGNYLKPSIAASGLDPEALPDADKSKMDFGSAAKAWRDIWGAGQGLGAISDAPSAGETIARMVAEYGAAKADLAAA